jgi:spore cortex biosynthesis protein YabQ
MAAQTRLFFYTVALGAATGVIYDLLRLFRRRVRHPFILVNIEDGFYWVLVSVLMFYFMLNRNFGEIRLFSVIGFFTGMTLYFLTVSRLVLPMLGALTDLINKLLFFTVKMLVYPMVAAVRILKIPVYAFLKLKDQKTADAKKVLQKVKGYATIRKRKLLSDLKARFTKV